MVKTLSFYINKNLFFQSPLQSLQCIEINKNGQRCKHNTIIGSQYCYIYLLYNKHLRIKTSLIQRSGKGLLAMNPKLPDNGEIFKKY